MNVRSIIEHEPTVRLTRSIADRYVLEGEVGAGGMGRVYRARHAQLGKVFALKVIRRAFADDDAARARFMREAKLASEISHPNLVSVIDFGEDPGVGAFMVMELVDGKPLLPEPGKPLSIKRALDVLAQLADALDHIHRHAIVHGDVKADNVLLVAEQSGWRRRHAVRLLDFGLAHRAGAAEQVVCGTPQYLAPECAGGAEPTPASDLYALGILGFQMVTGRVPFDGSIVDVLTAQVSAPPPALAAVRGEPVESGLEALIQRALAKDPEQRHRSAAAFGYELNAVMERLALTRRRPAAVLRDNARDATISLLFERSLLPQALIDADGKIALANAAFAQLLGSDDDPIEGGGLADTVLAAHLPDLVETIAATRASGRPSERRARIEQPDGPALEVGAWIAPFEQAVHLVVRVEELAR